jgi:hypothetical protein
MVEIIPKPIKRASNWPNVLLYFSLAALVAAISGFLILNSAEKKSTDTLQRLEDDIARIGGPEVKAMEGELFAASKKINDFSVLLDMHQKSSNFFQLLEKDTHPQVWFSSLTLDVNNSQAAISGKSPNFQIFGQQLLILQSDTSIGNVELSELSIGEEGDVEFDLILYLDPRIFQ